MQDPEYPTVAHDEDCGYTVTGHPHNCSCAAGDPRVNQPQRDDAQTDTTCKEVLSDLSSLERGRVLDASAQAQPHPGVPERPGATSACRWCGVPFTDHLGVEETCRERIIYRGARVEAEREAEEQARLLGMSAERETALRAKLANAEREIAVLRENAKFHPPVKTPDPVKGALLSALRRTASGYGCHGNELSDQLCDMLRALADNIEEETK